MEDEDVARAGGGGDAGTGESSVSFVPGIFDAADHNSQINTANNKQQQQKILLHYINIISILKHAMNNHYDDGPCMMMMMIPCS